MEIIRKRIANLLSVKSLVTIVLTIVFAYMAVTGKISQDFMTIYAVIIAFYFGTQSQKTQDILDNNESKEGSAMMKSSELVAKVTDIAKHYKTLYVMGCFGAPMTAANGVNSKSFLQQGGSSDGYDYGGFR